MDMYSQHLKTIMKALVFFNLLALASAKRFWKRQYDYVIVGGGTAGCVLASRLTENPKLNVLLLEAGTNIFDNKLVSIPRTWTKVALNREFLFDYVTEPEPGLENRTLNPSVAKLLGGSSSHNALAVVRGSRYDFDHWEDLGNKGWGYDDILPYFKKTEMVLAPELASNGYHGRKGPWKTNWAFQHPVQNVLIDAAKELNFRVTEDINGGQTENIGLAQTNVARDGSRSSTAESHLKPALSRPNLDLVTEAFVRKIKIKGKKAAGVIFEMDRGGERFFVKANKEVILSAGSFNSPKILMLSGIGPRDHLQSLGIEVVADLPVGKRLLEHPNLLHLLYQTNMTVSKLLSPENLFKYVFQGTGWWSSTGTIAYGLFPSNTQPLNSKVNFIEIIFSIFAQSLPDEIAELIWNGKMIPQKKFNSFKNSESEQLKLGMLVYLVHPRSVGQVRLRSRHPYDSPIFHTNLMNNAEDVNDMIEAIRLSHQFAKTKAMQAIQTEFITQPDPRCKHYRFDTDHYWRCLIPKIVGSGHHFTGSCSMGLNGTVTDKLRVKGVKNLRVVDASVMPDYITGHTMAATIMIAEKASDMIKHNIQ